MEITLSFVGNQLSGVAHQVGRETLKTKGKLQLGLANLEDYSQYKALHSKLNAVLHSSLERYSTNAQITFSKAEVTLLEPLVVDYKLECAGHYHTWLQMPAGESSNSYFHDAWKQTLADAEKMHQEIHGFLEANLKENYVCPFSGKSV